jgi:hypothetical protein
MTDDEKARFLRCRACAARSMERRERIHGRGIHSLNHSMRLCIESSSGITLNLCRSPS